MEQRSSEQEVSLERADAELTPAIDTAGRKLYRVAFVLDIVVLKSRQPRLLVLGKMLLRVRIERA